jgi:CheY-like chemotaxis protein
VSNIEAKKTKTRQDQYKVLYVEDSPANTRLVSQIYKHRPYLNLRCCINADQAFDAINEENFDLILMDINLPGMNGMEITQTLRKQGHTIPILALSANAMPVDIDEAMRYGFNEYLVKPIDVIELLCQTDKALGLEPENWL